MLCSYDEISPIIGWNCLGLSWREYGHILVPWPPAVTMIFILPVCQTTAYYLTLYQKTARRLTATAAKHTVNTATD